MFGRNLIPGEDVTDYVMGLLTAVCVSAVIVLSLVRMVMWIF